MPTAPPFVLTYLALSWCLFAVSVGLLWFGWRDRSKASGKVLLNLGFVAALLGAFEIVNWVKSPTAVVHKPNPHVADDPDLGYTALPNKTGSVERSIDGAQLYAIDCTFDEHGTRLIKPMPGAATIVATAKDEVAVRFLLAGYAEGQTPWRLHARDAHPTANANATMAAVLRDIILPPE